MANINGIKKWSPVRLLETHELARGGVNGNLNEQAQALADRTELLMEEKASKTEIVQGVFEFGTYAEFDAAKLSLPLNCTVIINEIPTGTQTWGQGTNRWNGTTLTKSPHDPLTQAKADATTKADLAEANAKQYVDSKVGSLYKSESINLFNKATVSSNYRVDSATGNLIAQSGYNASDYISVQQLYQYKRVKSTATWYSFYDVNKGFISGAYLPSGSVIRTPANAAFMKFTIINADLDSEMLVRAEYSTAAYIAYDTKKVDSLQLDSQYVGSQFETVLTNNLLDLSKVEYNIPYNTTNGTNTGGLGSQTWMLLSAKPAYFYSTTLVNSAFIFYDAAMNFINSQSAIYSAKAPTNTAYVRVRLGVNNAISSVYNAVVLESSNIADAYFPRETKQLNSYSRFGLYKSQWYQKTWFVMGDSISTGNGIASTYASKPYHYLIAKEKRCRVHNIAVSGRTIAVASNADNLNQQVTNGKMPDTANAPDLITIFAGTNDFGFNIPMGAISDTDPATFYGGLNKLFTDIQERFPYAKVGVITPIQRSDRADLNALGLTLGNYVDAIKITARNYAIPVLDLYTDGCGINFNSDAMTQIYTVNNDKIHPNDAGHKILAPKIAAFIESL